MNARLPTIFVTHGGGPLPLLGDPQHAKLTKFLKGSSSLAGRKPAALLMVTAHWEESVPTIGTSPAPPMLYDYGGFPPESYQLKYPAPGPSHELAQRVKGLLTKAGIPCRENSKRGFDHGTFVPLMLMYPDADIPVLQMSVMESLDPQAHYQLGRALAPLRDEDVLIIGSGSSFHNLPAMFAMMRGGGATHPGVVAAKAFDEWLISTCTKNTGAAREKLLNGWKEAPGGLQSQPREEHLIPLMVAAGAADQDPGRVVGQFEFKSDAGAELPMSSFVFG
eukprot:CAMPEP_0202901368 /NCGR_PEP_ID=MMETSP1392-20130828/14214_1 /ASSEMBLY_ACC=CAM_ASM_000868 /TAXON_ID=225041 /ORGANISM="Chlamydomonas chlamydogama, Strain SAG 11-48b" /LENGTH=277 /DNA_ID=CAMNT_0049587919 /DNA_START=298 /DNA_END=1131 /DNA_ORIENTATION=-